MSDERQAADARLRDKSGSAEAWHRRQPDTPLTRFLGGTPLNVVLRLFFLSLVVGALLMWLDIKPTQIIEELLHFVRRIWAMGFAAFRHLGNYFVAGAMIVVPVWLVLRLANIRGSDH